MNPEKLAMLTPTGIDLNHIPGGGIPDVTSMDVAGALRRLDRYEHELLMVKYAGIPARRMAGYWQGKLQQLDWDINLQDLIYVALFTLHEYISPNRCSNCKGRGEIESANKVAPCTSCSGSGHTYGSPRREFRHQVDQAREELRRMEYEAWTKVEG